MGKVEKQKDISHNTTDKRNSIESSDPVISVRGFTVSTRCSLHSPMRIRISILQIISGRALSLRDNVTPPRLNQCDNRHNISQRPRGSSNERNSRRCNPPRLRLIIFSRPHIKMTLDPFPRREPCRPVVRGYLDCCRPMLHRSGMSMRQTKLGNFGKQKNVLTSSLARK
jgi:hypothetical protein